MHVYRITLAKWSKDLVASGNSARWNTKGNFIIYTASTRALACLENVVHRSGEGLSAGFRVLEISIPPKTRIEKIKSSELPVGWHDFVSYVNCQSLGDNWYFERKTAILQVPSAIIQDEYNYLLNPNHPHFSKIKLVGAQDFYFDSRLKKLSSKK